MEAKKTLGIGLVLLVVGLLLAKVWAAHFWTVVLGGIALILLLAAALFLMMGYVQVREDQATLAKEAAQAAEAEAMAAKAE